MSKTTRASRVGTAKKTTANKSYHVKVVSSDAEAISAQIKAVSKDDKLMKEILIESGIYNSRLKLTKHYK